MQLLAAAEGMELTLDGKGTKVGRFGLAFNSVLSSNVTITPVESLSIFVTPTSAAFKPLYDASALVAAAVTMLYAISPSSTKSLTPVTVIV